MSRAGGLIGGVTFVVEVWLAVVLSAGLAMGAEPEAIEAVWKPQRVEWGPADGLTATQEMATRRPRP